MHSLDITSAKSIVHKIFHIFGYNQIYSVGILIIFLSLYAYVLSINIEEKYRYSYGVTVGMSDFIELIQLVAMQSIHILMIVESIFHIKEQVNFQQEVIELDEYFRLQLNEKINNRKYRSTILRNGVILLISYMCSEIYVIGATIKLDLGWNYIYYYLWYAMALLPAGLRYYQMFVDIYLIQYRLDKLCNYLERFEFVSSPLSSSSTFNSDQIMKSSLQVKTINYNHLNAMRDIYRRIKKLNSLFNKSYGFSLLFGIANDFFSSVCSCYWLFVVIRKSKGLLVVSSTFIYVLPSLINLNGISVTCHHALSSASNLAQILLNKKVDSTDIRQNAFVEQFSLQLLHQKIEFSAFDLFKVNYTLLLAMSSAMATYLIILIQFLMDELPIMMPMSTIREFNNPWGRNTSDPRWINYTTAIENYHKNLPPPPLMPEGF